VKNNFHNKEIGKYGEDIVCKYLEQNGYNIICRNFKTYNYEIDIISEYKNEIIFIEVKTRTSKQYGFPIESVNELKKKHIISATKYYVYKNSLENRNIRFDIIEVYVKEKESMINHIKNVFF